MHSNGHSGALVVIFTFMASEKYIQYILIRHDIKSIEQ